MVDLNRAGHFGKRSIIRRHGMIEKDDYPQAKARDDGGPVVLPEDCISRACDCEHGECHFKRCSDCDRLVDDDGITCDPRGCCFYCKAD